MAIFDACHINKKNSILKNRYQKGSLKVKIQIDFCSIVFLHRKSNWMCNLDAWAAHCSTFWGRILGHILRLVPSWSKTTGGAAILHRCILRQAYDQEKISRLGTFLTNRIFGPLVEISKLLKLQPYFLS